jgi:hypothetical protein
MVLSTCPGNFFSFNSNAYKLANEGLQAARITYMEFWMTIGLAADRTKAMSTPSAGLLND